MKLPQPKFNVHYLNLLIVISIINKLFGLSFINKMLFLFF